MTGFGHLSRTTSPRERIYAAGDVFEGRQRRHEIEVARAAAEQAEGKRVADRAAYIERRRRAITDRVGMALSRYLLRRDGEQLGRIIFEVCDKYAINYAALFSIRGEARLARARWECWWRARDETVLSYPEIGRFFGRDHTTIMHGVRKYEASLVREVPFS